MMSLGFLRLVFGLLLSLSSYAQVESVLKFQGQNGEIIQIDQEVSVISTRMVEVPATCYRDVPYENRECRTETRYRNQCHWVPASQSCHMVNERVCHNVTRTRQECSRGPDRQVCHPVPARQVCTERPTRQVCSTTPQGQRSCQTVGGGQHCETVGGGTRCDSVPGDHICRNVSYIDQECRNIPRQHCQTIPGREVCQQVAYNEQVCGNVTRYRKEPYSCTQTQSVEVSTPKKLTGAIQVQFITNGLVEEFPIKVSAIAESKKFEKFNLQIKLLKEPKVMVLVKKKSLKSQESEKEISLEGEVVIEVIEAQKIAPIFPTKLILPSFASEKSILSVGIEGMISARGHVEALIMTKARKPKKIAALKSAYPSERAVIDGSRLELDFSTLMESKLAKQNEVTVKLVAPLNVSGILLNEKVPELSREYKFELKK